MRRNFIKKKAVGPAVFLFSLIFVLLFSGRTAAFAAEDSDIIIDPGVKVGCAKLAEAKYALIPTGIKEKIMDMGYAVRVSPDGTYTGGHAGRYHSFRIQGLFYTYPYYPYIAVNASGSKKVNMSVCHEVGHFVDNYYGTLMGYPVEYNYKGQWVSEDPVFQEAYAAEEGQSGYPEYITRNTMEYFAECFRDCLERPEDLRKRCPQSYAFVSYVIAVASVE